MHASQQKPTLRRATGIKNALKKSPIWLPHHDNRSEHAYQARSICSFALFTCTRLGYCFLTNLLCSPLYSRCLRFETVRKKKVSMLISRPPASGAQLPPLTERSTQTVQAANTNRNNRPKNGNLQNFQHRQQEVVKISSP